jgi:hypothetical protein
MKTNYQISPEEFIVAWETSESVPEVVENLRRLAKAKGAKNMSKTIVLSRASSYRTLGVNLKKMKRKHGKPIDVKALNNLVSKINQSGRLFDKDVVVVDLRKMSADKATA